MPKKVFISYSHKLEDWVWEYVRPCLHFGGAEVLIDKERFKAGKAVIGQMDDTQDKADIHVLVFSPDYLASSHCKHEMKRAIDQDPLFQQGIVIPVLRVACNLPIKITQQNPIYINLLNDKNSHEWDQLLKSCKVDLGCAAPDWLQARDDIVRFLNRNDSVNLVVSGRPKYHELIQHIKEDYLPDLGIVDLESGATATREALVSEILKACTAPIEVPSGNKALVVLDQILKGKHVSRLAIKHFHLIKSKKYHDINLFAALRNLIMDSRKLVLLVHSNEHFSTLMPKNHPLSPVDIKTVELEGGK